MYNVLVFIKYIKWYLHFVSIRQTNIHVLRDSKHIFGLLIDYYLY